MAYEKFTLFLEKSPLAQGAGMTQDDLNAIAARVISIEADALHQMAGDLPSDFASAVEAIL